MRYSENLIGYLNIHRNTLLLAIISVISTFFLSSCILFEALAIEEVAIVGEAELAATGMAEAEVVTAESLTPAQRAFTASQGLEVSGSSLLISDEAIFLSHSADMLFEVRGGKGFISAVDGMRTIFAEIVSPNRIRVFTNNSFLEFPGAIYYQSYTKPITLLSNPVKGSAVIKYINPRQLVVYEGVKSGYAQVTTIYNKTRITGYVELSKIRPAFIESGLEVYKYIYGSALLRDTVIALTQDEKYFKLIDTLTTLFSQQDLVNMASEYINWNIANLKWSLNGSITWDSMNLESNIFQLISNRESSWYVDLLNYKNITDVYQSKLFINNLIYKLNNYISNYSIISGPFQNLSNGMTVIPVFNVKNMNEIVDHFNYDHRILNYYFYNPDEVNFKLDSVIKNFVKMESASTNAIIKKYDKKLMNWNNYDFKTLYDFKREDSLNLLAHVYKCREYYKVIGDSFKNMVLNSINLKVNEGLLNGRNIDDILTNNFKKEDKIVVAEDGSRITTNCNILIVKPHSKVHLDSDVYGDVILGMDSELTNRGRIHGLVINYGGLILSPTKK